MTWQSDWDWLRPYSIELLVRLGTVVLGVYLTYGVVLIHLDVVYELIVLSCAEGGWSFVWSDLSELDATNGMVSWWLSLYRWIPVRWYHWLSFVNSSCTSSEWLVVKWVSSRGLFAWVAGLVVCTWWYVPEMWGDAEDRLEGVSERVSMPEMTSFVDAWMRWFGVSMLLAHVPLLIDRLVSDSASLGVGWSLLRRRLWRVVFLYVRWGGTVESIDDAVVVSLPMMLVWEWTVVRRVLSRSLE